MAHESLNAVRVALDLAVSQLSKLDKSNQKFGCSAKLDDLRQMVGEELEWRFTRLRAILGLKPLCVETPVARVLLADFVERLIPEIKSIQLDMNKVQSCETPTVAGDYIDYRTEHESVVESTTVDEMVDDVQEICSNEKKKDILLS